MLCLSKDEKQIKQFDKFLEISKLLDGNAKVSKAGDNNAETALWLFKKANGGDFDYENIPIEDHHLKRYKREVKTYLKNYEKMPTWFQKHFYIPAALMRNIKGGDEFYNNVAETMSFHQRQVKESQDHIGAMTQGLYDMIIDQGWNEQAYGDYAKFERTLMTVENPDQMKAMIKQLGDIVGTVDQPEGNMPIGGKVLRRFQGLLEYTVEPVNDNERMIQREWNILRASSVNNLLNGIVMSKMAIRSKLANDPEAEYLLRSLRNLQDKADELLLSTSQDKKIVTKGEATEAGDINADIKVYNPATKSYEPYRVLDSDTGQFAYGIKKYVPSYVIELTALMDNIVDYGMNKNKSRFKNKSAEDIEIETQNIIKSDLNTARLKAKGETEYLKSLDPVYYLNKYANDVASFNARARINYAFMEGTKVLRKNIINDGKYKGGNTGDYAHTMIDMMTHIKDSALNQHRGQMDSLDDIVQIVNAFEYVSKLGFSIRGAVKNRSQRLFNYVFYGRKGLKRSKDWIARSSREFEFTPGEEGKMRTNAQIIATQKKRFGYEMTSSRSDAFKSAATGGSIDFLYVPKGFSLDKQGKLIPEGAKGALKKVSEIASKATDISSITMQWAENKNRNETFDIAFANSYVTEQKNIEYHKKQLRQKLKREPSTKEIYDRIENVAGNMANQMVRTIHYDYDTWAKAKVLGTKPGKVLGQYQHFKFAFFDMQYNIIKNAVNDVKDLSLIEKNPITGQKQISENVQRMMRLGAIYTIIPGIAGYFGLDLGGLFGTIGNPFDEDRESTKSSTKIIENPVLEDMENLYTYFTSDDPTARAAAYYGKNPITGNLGPFISDLMMIAELTDFINQTDEEYAESRHLNYDPDSSDWWYNVGRIFSIQGARTFHHSIPALRRGDIAGLARVELGIFQPKWMKNHRARVMGKIDDIYNSSKMLPNIRTGKKKKGAGLSSQRKKAIQALRNF